MKSVYISIQLPYLLSPIPQNDQKQSSNSSTVADELFGYFDHFMGLTLKVLKTNIAGAILVIVYFRRNDFVGLALKGSNRPMWLKDF